MTSTISRAAIVTGASTGLGYAIACALAREGYDLAVADLDVAMFDALLREPVMQGRKVVTVKLDLRSESDIAQAFATAAEALGAVGLLVNNAGRALIKPAGEVTWADWDDVININLKGAYFLSQKFAAHCIARKQAGCIVSIASTHGITGLAGRSVYGISKAGLIQMSRMLAIEWAAQNIRVNAIAPATALTPSRQRLLDEAARERMLARIPSGRFITPEEIAAAVCYLASLGAASITGHTLTLDGGLTAL
ncbi:MAG: SDR family NAD(P)-dependent oxidoreductase [Pseudolabrys sp.]|jgi:NAD(P)-dependent dehydrogenase (short-subunit alcohol dehydrogenase family)